MPVSSPVSSSAVSTVPEEFALLVARFAPVTDPRHARGKVHPLPGVQALVVLGLLAGCRSPSAVGRYGAIHPEALAPLGLRRSPSVATLHRLPGMVAVAEVRAVLRAVAQDLIERRGPAAAVTGVALDGKTLRGTHEDGAPLHVLRAVAQRAELALDQAPASRLRGEVAAATTWVTELAAAFPGLAILTGDALFAEQSLGAAVVAGQRDDVFRPKKNQPSLFADITRLFVDPRAPDVVTTGKGHGRIERRELRVRPDLAGYAVFPGLAQVAELRTEVVRVSTGEVTHSTHYLITSLGPDAIEPAQLLGVARRHWGVENRWFHVAGDGFGEDRQVLQTHHRGQVLGTLRGMAPNLLRGACPLWSDATPLTAPAEWVSGHPLAILSGL